MFPSFIHKIPEPFRVLFSADYYNTQREICHLFSSSSKGEGAQVLLFAQIVPTVLENPEILVEKNHLADIDAP